MHFLIILELRWRYRLFVPKSAYTWENTRFVSKNLQTTYSGSSECFILPNIASVWEKTPISAIFDLKTN